MYVKESILCPLDMETLPNPFGGVNTHLWRNVAYVFGIVPSSSAFYTRNEIGRHLISSLRPLSATGVVRPERMDDLRGNEVSWQRNLANDERGERGTE